MPFLLVLKLVMRLILSLALIFILLCPRTHTFIERRSTGDFLYDVFPGLCGEYHGRSIKNSGQYVCECSGGRTFYGMLNDEEDEERCYTGVGNSSGTIVLLHMVLTPFKRVSSAYGFKPV